MIRVERTVEEKYIVPFNVLRRRLGIRSGSLHVVVKRAGSSEKFEGNPWQWNDDLSRGARAVVVFVNRYSEVKTRRNRK